MFLATLSDSLHMLIRKKYGRQWVWSLLPYSHGAKFILFLLRIYSMDFKDFYKDVPLVDLYQTPLTHIDR